MKKPSKSFAKTLEMRRENGMAGVKFTDNELLVLRETMNNMRDCTGYDFGMIGEIRLATKLDGRSFQGIWRALKKKVEINYDDTHGQVYVDDADEFRGIIEPLPEEQHFDAFLKYIDKANSKRIA